MPPDRQAQYVALLQRLGLIGEQEKLRDLASFAKEAWRVLEPSTPLLWSWHLDLICEYLTLVRDRQLRRLVINVPPQSSKSRFVTVFYPAWTWATTAPGRRFMTVSYSGGATGLSTIHSTERRTVLESQWFQQHFPGRVIFTGNQKTQYENTAGGRMIATSTGGTATGKGVHDIICDDLINPKQAESDLERKAGINFYDKTLLSRLSDQRTGCIVIVEQRLHEEDLTGHVLEKQKELEEQRLQIVNQGGAVAEADASDTWTVVSLPMRALEYERWVFPISGRVVERQPGELLIPERFTESVVHRLEVNLGPRAYSSQYQQQPSPKGGVIFDPNWWQYYELKMHLDEKNGMATYGPELPMLEMVVLSIDCAFKSSVDNDLVSMEVWGFTGTRNYLIDKETDHMSYVATKAKARAMKQRHPRISVFLVEDKANGSAVIEELQRESFGVYIIAIDPEGGKVPRAWACSPAISTGNTFLPQDAPWVGAFVDLWAKFPAVAHDDDVDSGTQALNWRKSQWMRLGLVEYIQQQQAAQAEPKVITAENAKVVTVATPQPTNGCPKCGAVAISKVAGHWRCGQCGNEWGGTMAPRQDLGLPKRI